MRTMPETSKKAKSSLMPLIYRRSGKPFLITLEPKPHSFYLLELGVVCLILAAVGLFALAGGK